MLFIFSPIILDSGHPGTVGGSHGLPAAACKPDQKQGKQKNPLPPVKVEEDFIFFIWSMRGLFVFVPALDAYIVNAHGAERLDEGAGQTSVGYKRNIQVDGGAADLVSVVQLAG